MLSERQQVQTPWGPKHTWVLGWGVARMITRLPYPENTKSNHLTSSKRMYDVINIIDNKNE